MKKIIWIIALLLALTSCNGKEIYIPDDFENATANMYAVFMNLEGGRSSFFELPTGETLLIDCGASEDFPALYDILRQREVKRLDYIILSSDTPDCTGGLGKISSNFEIGDVYTDRNMQNISDYRRICANNANGDCSLYLICEGTRIYDNGGVCIDVVSSGICQNQDGNTSAVCLYISYGEVTWFYEGNCDYIAEREIISSMSGLIEADIISVPHGGMEYLPSDELLNELKPRYAVISVCDGLYPREELEKRLVSRGADILRPDRDGDVSFVTDGRSVDVYTQR